MTTVAEFDALMANLRDVLAEQARRIVKDAHHLSMSLDASDLVQDVLLTTLHRICEMMQEWGEERTIYYLRKILKRRLIKAVHDHARGCEQPLEAAPAQELRDRQPAPDLQVEQQEERIRVDAAVGDLPERQREAIRLRHWEHQTLAEVAERMKISIPSVYGLIKRGQVQIEKRLRPPDGQ